MVSVLAGQHPSKCPAKTYCVKVILCLSNILSVSRSIQCRLAMDRGHVEEAKKLSKDARTARFISLALGIVIYVVAIVREVAALPQQ